MGIKFYTDTHIPKPVAIQLRNKHVDILRCEEAGLATASDSEHLEFASKEKRVLVSQDYDFLHHHYEWLAGEKSHSGIIVIHPRYQGNVGKIVTELLEFHELIESGAGTLQDNIENQCISIK